MTPAVLAGDVSLFYESFGEGVDTLLLIAGYGGQLTDWHDDLVDEFVRHGFRVIRFDNRDAGLSTHLDAVLVPSLLDIWEGTAIAPYSLDDMAGDVAALLRSLGVESTFILAHSMGSMIAQCLAIAESTLVRGLVLVAGTTGSRDVGQSSPEIVQAQLTASTKTSFEKDPLDAGIQASSRWASWDLGMTEDELRARIKRRVDRNVDRAGASRQLAAVLSTPDRTEALHGVMIPTVLVHGTDDPLVHCSGSEATVEAMPNAELLLIDKLRHDLPRVIWPTLIDAVERVRNQTLPTPL